MEMKYYSLYAAGLILFVFFILQSLIGLNLAWQVGSFDIRFFTSMVSHSGMPHLLGNLFSLLLFGLLLESVVGSMRFLKILFWAAVVGNLAGIGSYNAVLGISGGIYGLIGALSVLRPKMVIWLSGLPMPMILVGVAYAFIDLLGAIDPVSNTGHLAHLAGLVVGLVAGFMYRKQFPDNRSSSRSQRMDKQTKKAIDKQLDEYERRYLKE